MKMVGANGRSPIENTVHGHNGNIMHRHNDGHNDGHNNGCNDVHNVGCDDVCDNGHNNERTVGANGRSPLQSDLPELPKGWETAMLNELLISLESGSRPKGGVRGIKKGTPSIGGEHLKYDGTFDFSSIKYVSEEFASAMTKGHIQTGDILIIKDGATTGKTVFVDRSFPFKDAVVNEHVFICRPSQLIEPRFIFRFLMSKEGQERILENFQGSAQGGINLSFAPNTEIPLSPLNEQRRIVAKLERLLHKVDACKGRLDKIPAIIKRFRQSVLSAACSGRLTKDWREKNREMNKTVGANGRSPLQEDLQLPNGWCLKTIGELEVFIGSGITPKGGKAVYVKNGIPFIRSQNVYPQGLILDDIAFITPEVHKSMSRTQLKPKDILLNITGASIGRSTLVPENLKQGNVNQHVCIIRLQPIVIPEFVSMFLNSPGGQDLIFSAQTGVTREGLNYGQIRGFEIPLPPPPEQHEIVRRVDALFKKADEIGARYQKAKAFVDKLTQSILAKAFRGELVPQDPNDETAAVLLERIKAERKIHEPKRKSSLRKGSYDTR